MKKASILLLFIACSNFSLAQIEIVDSLKASLSTTSEDTTRVDILNSISNSVFSSSPDEAIKLGNQAKELAEGINYQTGLAYALKSIGLGYYIHGDYIEASVNWKKSLEIFESIQDDLGSANLLSNLGVIYYNQGDDAKAIDYHLKSLKLSEKLGDSLRIATALSNIGAVYSIRAQSLKYYRRALSIGEIIENLGIIGMNALNIGNVFLETGNDSAIYYLEKSLIAFENTVDAGEPLNKIGLHYRKKGEFQLAVDYHLNAIKIATSFDAKYELANSLLGLAGTYRSMGSTRKAIVAFQRAQTIADEIGADYTLLSVYRGLAISFEDLSDYKSANNYRKMFDVVKDSIYNAETDDKIKTMQFSYEIDKREGEIEILEKTSEIEGLQIKRQETVIYAGSIMVFLLILMGIGLYNRYNYAQRTKKIIEIEKDKSETLLLNILPSEVAAELKEKGESDAKDFENVSVIFSDFKGFTSISEHLSAQELVAEINTCFKAFDKIITSYGIEKIKTIGDSYMAAGGLHTPRTSSTKDVIMAGLEMQAFMEERRGDLESQDKTFFEMRVGIHTGPVVAGIVGVKKFQYDIWGDTVNIASRMESSGEIGTVNISEATYNLVKEEEDLFFEQRGKIEAKNKGMVEMYFVKKAS